MPDTSTPTTAADRSSVPDPSAPTAVNVPTSGPLNMPPATATKTLYFNGFWLGMSNADIVARLNLENVPLVDLRMSFTVAKTLAEKLSETVARFEKITNHKVMTTEDVFKALKEAGLAK